MYYSYKFAVHPDDIESREKENSLKISQLHTQVEELLAANMGMKLDLSQVLYLTHIVSVRVTLSQHIYI